MSSLRRFGYFLLIAASLCVAPVAGAQNFKIDAGLDPILGIPQNWTLTASKLEERFPIEGENKKPYFKWLTRNKTRALFQRRPYSNVDVNLTIFDGEVQIEEAIVDFKNGKFLGTTISIYNRGDGGEISGEEFTRRFQVCGKKIGKLLNVSPFRREARPKQGQLTSGYIWLSQAGMAVLEYNPEAILPDGKPGNAREFLRLRLARRDAKGAYAAAMKTRAGATTRLSDLPDNVKEDNNGNVFVDGIPMVDQGQKGYCVVASAQRLFEYYGIPCDQHQLAQIADADPEAGTSTLKINQELGKIDHLFKTRFEALAVAHNRGLVELEDDRYVGDEVTEKDFHKLIRKYIDDGIPLLWSLELGIYPEEPSIAQQAGGGHMRMIIGYNDETSRVIFSDSWGAGHEFKTMAAYDCYRATRGLFLLQPTTH